MDDLHQLAVADDIGVIIHAEHAFVDQPFPTHTGCADAHRTETAGSEGFIRPNCAARDIAFVIRHVHRRRRMDHAVFEGQVLGLERLKKRVGHV